MFCECVRDWIIVDLTFDISPEVEVAGVEVGRVLGPVCISGDDPFLEVELLLQPRKTLFATVGRSPIINKHLSTYQAHAFS